MPSTLGARTLVVADVASTIPVKYQLGSRVVRTPLDLVLSLDEPLERVVLVGEFAHDRAYARFIRETCRSIDVIVIGERVETSAQLRAVFV
jgi:hypothetical protein